MKISLYAVVVAMLLAGTSCDMREARLKSFDKDHWIQVVMGTPLPAGITGLEGIGDTWQGFWCHFRFRIDAGGLLIKVSDDPGYQVSGREPKTNRLFRNGVTERSREAEAALP